MKQLWCVFVMCVASQAAMAQATPAGLWKTIDDATQKERSLVRITEAAGIYSGRIEKSLNPDEKPDAVCEKCTDERKNKPLIGMVLIRNITQNASDKEVFDGGDVVDPDNGKIYRLRLKPIDGGKKLEVRGYIGPFYRNQVWLRAE
jgi:uncharacterized protein (DUF2147 family)